MRGYHYRSHELMNTKRIIKEYYKQCYAHKFITVWNGKSPWKMQFAKTHTRRNR